MTRRHLTLATCSLTLLAGCASPGSKTAAGPARPPQASPQPAPVPPPSPVAVSSLRERALQTLEELSSHEDAQVRANVVESASMAAGRLASIIERGLRDPMPAVRTVAAMGVGKARLKEMLPSLGPLLSDATPHVRAAAIYAHIRCGQDVDRNPLASMLLEDESPWVRRHAAFVLGEIGDPTALPLLRAAARTPFPTASPEQLKNLQLQLAEAMAKLGDVGARQAVRAALYPSRPEELEATALAIQIIGQINDREALDQLAFLAESRDRSGQTYPAEIRLAVAGTMAMLGSSQGLAIADQYATDEKAAIRAQAAFVYGESGGGASWTRLDQMLTDRSNRVRVAAAAGVLRAFAR